MIYFILVIYVTKVYIVRHCETDGNSQKLFQGHLDLDINELGKNQLEALSKRFSNLSIDAVYTSPLLRTRRTAEAIVGNRDIPIISDGSLIELNGGVYEGKTYAQIGIEYPDFEEIWCYRPWDFAPQNGEKMTDAYERIWSAVKRIAQVQKNKTVAITTHGGVIRCLLCKILKDNIKEICEIPFGENTAISLLEFDDTGKINLIYFNDSSHLTKELKNKNAKVPVGDK